MAQNDLVICDFCFQRVKVEKYRDHVMLVHRVSLPADLDIQRKIIDDWPRIKEINEENKKKEEEKLNKQLSEFKEKIQVEKKHLKKDDSSNIIHGNFILCDYCPDLLSVEMEYYGSHLNEKHNLQISAGYDFEKKRRLDSEIISLSNQLQSIKKWDNKVRRKQDEFRELYYQRKREIERNIKELADTKELKIIWDDVIFGKDQIRIDVKRLNTIVKPIYVKGVFESLNLIKKEYFQRLYANKIYRIVIYNGNIVYEKSPGWNTLLQTIEFAKEYYYYKYSPDGFKSRMKKFTHLTNKELILLFEASFDKSIYLKHLASQQSNDFRIIPISEFISKHVEESFIFRFKTKSGKILYVWENINDSRACHLFVSNQTQGEDTLDRIEEFINRQDLTHKRSLLYESGEDSKKIRSDLNYLSFIKHDSLSGFKSQLEKFIKSN